MPDATIVFNQTWNNQQIRNVTVWDNVRDPEPDIQELADNLRGTWALGVGALMENNWTLDSITVINNDSDPVFSIVVPFTAGPLQGTNEDGPPATQTSLLVSTQFQGPPPNRGRIYFGGIAKSSLDLSGLWNAAVADNFGDMVQLWAEGISTATNEFFLRIARRGETGLIAVSSPVTTAIARLNPATQRRRRRGQGI